MGRGEGASRAREPVSTVEQTNNGKVGKITSETYVWKGWNCEGQRGQSTGNALVTGLIMHKYA